MSWLRCLQELSSEVPSILALLDALGLATQVTSCAVSALFMLAFVQSEGARLAEALTAASVVARERLLACVRELVHCECFQLPEAFGAASMVARIRPLARVRARVRSELAFRLEALATASVVARILPLARVRCEGARPAEELAACIGGCHLFAKV